MALLEFKNVSVTYRSKTKNVYAVKNFNLKVEKGDSVGIVGESGSGKSTAAMALLRLLPDSSLTEGEIIYKEKDILKLSGGEMNSLRWTDIAVVFQKSMNSLSPVHRIGKQFEDICKIHTPLITPAEVKEKTLGIFRMVNLDPRVYRLYPHELSGGMMQRVSIALSLIDDPDLLIMDESTTALDVITQGQILHEINKIQEKMHLTKIMITHDLTVVASTCNKTAVLYAGELMEEGPADTVMVNPRHPYTKGLIDSLPETGSGEKKMKSIPGSLPDLSVKYEGCIYYSRCPHRMNKCLKVKPEKREMGDGVSVYCHLYDEVENGK